MNHRYPFDTPSSTSTSTSISLVKLRRKFQQKQLPSLQTKLYNHYNIPHPSIIKIIKAFQSKKKQYFDIFFQWVPTTFRSQARYLSYAELQQKKLELLSLCSYLISMQIHPIITEDLIGITKDKLIKLYVDVDYSPIVGSVQELVRAKEIEISNIFKLYERASLFESPSPTSQSSQQVFCNMRENLPISLIDTLKDRFQSMGDQFSQDMDVPLSPVRKDRGNIVVYREPVEMAPVTKLEAEISISQRIIYEVREEVEGRQSSKNMTMGEGNLLNKSHREMKPQKDTEPPLGNPMKQGNILPQTNNQSSPAPPIPTTNQKQLSREYGLQMMRQPRLFKMQQNYHQIFQQQEISIVDTYKQELGSQKKMPKIKNQLFRQTTKEPPSITIPSVVPISEKSRMSAGEGWDNDFKSDRLPMVKHEGEERREGREERGGEKGKERGEGIKSPRGEHKQENGYYYQEAFGFGFEKNDPLTREFISLFEDANPSPSPEPQTSIQSKPNNNPSIAPSLTSLPPLPSNMSSIELKVRSALQNSMKTLQLFAKLKFNHH